MIIINSTLFACVILLINGRMPYNAMLFYSISEFEALIRYQNPCISGLVMKLVLRLKHHLILN